MKLIITVHNNPFTISDTISIQNKNYIVASSGHDYIVARELKWYWKLWYRMKAKIRKL